ncbi:toxin-antitoxin system TumE family protein [Ferrovibrio xuzhouensis]|uniref:DUF6516 family protein n=1 Tax=Ferrovibrio xuzhouensis TaxID=1576914 RepID=A0ABV7VJ02_9PROT
MKAELLMREVWRLDEHAAVEIVIWRLPKPLAGSRHGFKYRLAYIERNRCVLRYDNEAGKGDHRHAGRREQAYDFSDPDTLLADFWRDVDEWRRR